MSSLLFKRVLGRMMAPTVRRNIMTTPVKRSGADPMIGHVDQEAQPGAVSFSIAKFSLYFVL
jgi:hypothetical protein